MKHVINNDVTRNTYFSWNGIFKWNFSVDDLIMVSREKIEFHVQYVI